MDLLSVVWGPHFERTGARTSKCRLCGTEMDHAGGRPQRHILNNHPDLVQKEPTVTNSDTPAPPVSESDTPDEVAEKSPRQVREETLSFANFILADKMAPANARVAAGRLVSDIQKLEEVEDEEDEDEAEDRIVGRFQKAIARKTDLEEEFRVGLRDPSTLARVKRLVAEVEATL